MQGRLKKYLHSRAVLTPWQLAGHRASEVDAAIVIPALAEAETLPATLQSLGSNDPELLQRTLVIVVVNHRSDASSALRRNNATTLSWLASRSRPRLQLAWIDAAAPGLELPTGQGVGLARKIGFDAALHRLNWNNAPFLISLDADTLVDQSYLTALFRHFATVQQDGTVLPFRHQAGADGGEEEAIRAYELYLRSYQFGLQQAGSPYAYHSIGSAFACRAPGYIAAGGMNRRLAGEDFYFLQQLNKVGGVVPLQGTVVHPAPRCSVRVPFGTGRIVAQHQLGEKPAYRFIDTQAFAILREWLLVVAAQPDGSVDDLLRRAQLISPELAAFLKDRNFATIWALLQRNHAGSEQRLRAFHHWFDALRTRQLLTRLGQGGGDPIPLVSELLRWGGYPGCSDAMTQLRLLEGLQGVAGQSSSSAVLPGIGKVLLG
ncbi:glycosyltransferase [Pelovirga terrestris]|uniref:Glycosyltransferase family 2 protein n=1 Tax=Pelovirga terrestris TaxID=2771352 RepID=A0A8J6ULR1_9BACT|nr:glycosyltransferase family A protein [Pelovirga terrestris]MBD1401597.1 glycosyltransferase family 2 protein [Pelovirga terrestris]